MSETALAGLQSTKERILLVAERLMAERGVNGVSLRQIGAAVGNGNNSVVHYHFGTKDQLVSAIFDYRLPRLRHRRNLLVEDRRPAELRDWLECQIRAVFEQSELDGSHYMSFLASLVNGGESAFGTLPPEVDSSRREFAHHLYEFLQHIEEPLRSHRLDQAMAFVVQSAAARERARARGESVLPFALEVANLADGISAFLLAAPSPEARRLLEQSRDPRRPTAARRRRAEGQLSRVRRTR